MNSCTHMQPALLIAALALNPASLPYMHALPLQAVPGYACLTCHRVSQFVCSAQETEAAAAAAQP